MSLAGLFVVCLFGAFLMIGAFSLGLILGTELPARFQRSVDPGRILKAHKETVRRIDDVVDYYVELQKHIADRLDRLKE